MELFFKCTAALLLTCVLALVLRQEKDLSMVLTMAACTMGLMILVSFLEPVIDFLQQLQSLGDLNGSMLSILLKAVGIGLIAEIAAMICSDSGNASLGKTLQLLGSAVIIWLSLPLFQMLMDLVRGILGEL